MKAPKVVSQKKLPPAGNHVARVFQIIYIGTVKTNFKDDYGNIKEIPMVRISWELPLETVAFKEGDIAKPFVVSKEFTHSMFKKSALRPFVEGIIGVGLTDEEADGFDLDEIIGKPCLLSVVHTEKINGKFADVHAATPLVKGMVAPNQVNPSKILSYEKWDEEFFQKLPDFIKDKMKGSREYLRMRNAGPAGDIKVTPTDGIEYPEEEINPDDIPF